MTPGPRSLRPVRPVHTPPDLRLGDGNEGAKTGRAIRRRAGTRRAYMSIRFSPERYDSGSLENATRHPGPQK